MPWSHTPPPLSPLGNWNNHSPPSMPLTHRPPNHIPIGIRGNRNEVKRFLPSNHTLIFYFYLKLVNRFFPPNRTRMMNPLTIFNRPSEIWIEYSVIFNLWKCSCHVKKGSIYCGSTFCNGIVFGIFLSLFLVEYIIYIFYFEAAILIGIWKLTSERTFSFERAFKRNHIGPTLF